jgi:cytochrome c553
LSSKSPRRHALRLAAIALLAPALAAAAPRVSDTIAQRVQACTTCHGKEGRAATDGYHPRIAGKPAGYLANQLLNFRDGRRHYALMTALLDPLSDAYLHEMAAYFAALDLPYPPPQPVSAPAEVLQRGRQLATQGDAARAVPACTACHGDALTGVAPAVPGLLGLPRDYLVGQLGAWRTGQRRAQAPDCMAHVAQQLAPDDVVALSHWLAAQTVPARARPAKQPPGAWPLPCGGVPGAAP